MGVDGSGWWLMGVECWNIQARYIMTRFYFFTFFVLLIFSLVSIISEWAGKNADCGGIESRPPLSGNRIVVQLFWDVAPLACENFATLCANGSSFPNNSKSKPAPMGESGKPLTYRNTQVHRVIPGFVLQGGDFVFGNGSGGESVFGKKVFKDERAGLALTHHRKGVLSMGNSGKNSNSSQFFFTLDKAHQCDGKHVIFGKVVSGWEVLQAAETFGTTSGAGGQPTVPITITDCGIFTTTPPILATPGCGYWYDKPDPDSYSGISPVFMVRPRVAILAPTHAVISKFQAAMGPFVSVTAVSAEGMEEDISVQASRLVELLGTFSVDVVIIAPACKGVKSVLRLPKAWEAMGISMDEMFLEAKPVEALDAVRTKSWLAKQSQRQLDGT
jgi:peptidylprolyl isomerase